MLVMHDVKVNVPDVLKESDQMLLDEILRCFPNFLRIQNGTTTAHSENSKIQQGHFWAF